MGKEKRKMVLSTGRLGYIQYLKGFYDLIGKEYTDDTFKDVRNGCYIISSPGDGITFIPSNNENQLIKNDNR